MSFQPPTDEEILAAGMAADGAADVAYFRERDATVRALEDLMAEVGREKCRLLLENATLKELLRRTRNLHELPWKERVSLQDCIDPALASAER